jgi:hypothetical protein
MINGILLAISYYFQNNRMFWTAVLKIKNKKLIPSEVPGTLHLMTYSKSQIKNSEYRAINENLTVQIAKQIFKIPVTDNGLVFFKSGECALIVNNRKYENFKELILLADKIKSMQLDEYDEHEMSYQKIADLLKRIIGAYKVEIEKLFKAAIFNFLFSNNETDINNFYLHKNIEYGDYLSAPCRSLFNSSLHTNTETKNTIPLFTENKSAGFFKKKNSYTLDDISELGLRIGINSTRIIKILELMLSNSERVKEMIKRSLLSVELKETYFNGYYEKLSLIK